MKRTIVLLLAALTANSCLYAQASKNPFTKLGYKKQVMYTSSKGDFKEFHDQENVIEIGSIYFNTKTNIIVGFINLDKEQSSVAPAVTAMSVDPMCEKYYWISPYAYCLNNPVRFVDPDGRVVMSTQMQKDYPMLTQYVKNLSNEWNNQSSKFRTEFMEKSGLNEKQVQSMLTFGKGPELVVANLDNSDKQINGNTVGFKNLETGKYTNSLITLDDNVVGMLEGAQTGKDKQTGTTMVESTTFHELTHSGNLITSNNLNGRFTESGKAFEGAVFEQDINRSNVNNWQSLKPTQLPSSPVYLLPVQPIAPPKEVLGF